MSKKFKSKPFCIATEGATTDGRNIERSWLQQMAATYDRAKYGARIWLEHIRGTLPDSPFKAYGDVLALSAEEGDDKKMRLYAVLEPTEALLAMNKAKQKIYSSMEIDPNFAKSGQAYLVGLGVTDSPASLGTDILSFAAQKPESNPFASRKLTPDNLFSAAIETELEFEEVEDPADKPSLVDFVKGLFAKRDKESQADYDDMIKGVELLGTEVQQRLDTFNKDKASASDVAAVRQDVDKLQQSFNELKASLDGSSKHSQRPPATGGQGNVKTDF
ncbi:GPO family capsid scaffolding protein [Pigmentiphaga sp. CHJ604]|uniref:GPO family capsid scaffolding protein n=1 Tax=Pigmentiphaga sp. CHJ604 TaxID=3081984 RepID=UPI0030D5DE71